MLRSMFRKGYLKQYEDGAIGLSDSGERICCSLEFYAVFESEDTFSVRCNGQEIGTVDRAYKAEESFFLAGRTWRVLGCDLKRKRMDVEPGSAGADIHFNGRGALYTDRRTMEKIHQVLVSEERYSYLDEEAAGILQEIRRTAGRLGLRKLLAEEPGTDNLVLFPVLGTDTIRTLYYLWNSNGVVCEKVALRLCSVGRRELRRLTVRMLDSGCRVDRDLLLRKERVEGKYFEVLPQELKYRQLKEDALDLGGAEAFLRELVDIL